MLKFSILLCYLVNGHIIFKTTNRKEIFRFTQICLKVIKIISKSPMDRWVFLYHGFSYSFSWLKGTFFQRFKIYGNFSQVIPETAR